MATCEVVNLSFQLAVLFHQLAILSFQPGIFLPQSHVFLLKQPVTSTTSTGTIIAAAFVQIGAARVLASTSIVAD